MGLNRRFEGGTPLPPSEATAGFGSDSLPQSHSGATILPFPKNVQDQPGIGQQTQETQEAVVDLLRRSTPGTTAPVDYSSNDIGMDELRPRDKRAIRYYGKPELGTVAQIQALVAKLVAEEDKDALIEISAVVQDARAALGVAAQTDSILAQASAPSSDTMPASSDVAVSLGHNSGLPAWFLDLKMKLENGTIPRYAGKWHDGDPVDYLLSHYKNAVDARILTQAHLRALDQKLFTALNNAFRGDKRSALARILPPLENYQRITMH